MSETWRRADGYEISTDKGRIDLDVVHGFLTRVYWSENVPREVVCRSISGAFCFSVFDPAGAQVGFGRVITDFATFDGENRNFERARITGVEASWDYQAEPWTTRVSASLQDPRDLTNDQPLLRRSRESLTLNLTRALGAHQLSVDLLAAGQRQDFGFPAPVRLDAYLLVGLAGRFRLNDDWSLTARVENLFDEDYELARGYNTMGRSLFVALRRDFH